MKFGNLLKIDIAPNRIYGLDILRAVAILCVIFLHGSFITPSYVSEKVELLLIDGVSIFFVLSGFLIGGILIKLLDKQEPTIPVLIGFWKRRWYRTLPNYYLLLIIHTLIALFFWQGFNFKEAFRSFFFLQNFAWPHTWFFPESWSLSIEEWFYLLIPILIFILLNLKITSRKKSILFVSIFIILFVTGIRFGKYIWYLKNDPGQLYHIDLLFGKEVITRLDSLMYGVTAAYISFYFRDLFLRYKKLLFAGGILLFVVLKLVLTYGIVSDLFICVFSYSLISLATAMLLPFFSDFKKGKGVVYKSITYISLTSYSMYVLHLSFIKWFVIDFCLGDVFATLTAVSSETISWITQYVFYWFLTIVLSILLYKYFELPFMNMRDRKVKMHK